MPSTLVQVLSYILIRSLLAVARSTNRTIDDTFGDSVTQLQVIYTSNWHVGQTCSVCAVSPNRAQAYEGTWHDTTSDNPNSTVPHSASFRFNGTAVWVYGIVANSAEQGITIFTNASFEVDGLPLGSYEHVPQPTQDQYLYNVLLFSNTALKDTEHTLVMRAVQGSSASLLLFDYAVYTYNDSEQTSMSAASSTALSSTTSTLLPISTSSGQSTIFNTTGGVHPHHGTSVDVLIGSVVTGVVIFILLISAGICFMHRRRGSVRIKAKLEDQVLTPFVLPPKSDHLNNPASPHSTRHNRPPPAASVPKSVTTTTYTSILLAEASSSNPQTSAEKAVVSRGPASAEKYNSRKTRRRDTPVGGEQSFLDMESVASAPNSTAASSNVGYSSSAVSTGDAEMRRQFRLLERELRTLKTETQGLMTPTSPPPAYG